MNQKKICNTSKDKKKTAAAITTAPMAREKKNELKITTQPNYYNFLNTKAIWTVGLS